MSGARQCRAPARLSLRPAGRARHYQAHTYGDADKRFGASCGGVVPSLEPAEDRMLIRTRQGRRERRRYAIDDVDP
ncbi:hypothetical protein Ae706Ps2_6684 [Pseudonocardia sp. Ae706_Ps2]|nr:hypothetical protein Ae706Ps2_6684 [Pseudonocardia sp. Ae706_Ps2]